ncbi:MAG: hypothetical protein NT046_00525 [Arenimonas sp.]|nr:hypothetical protein [Arenimonas sp.]
MLPLAVGAAEPVDIIIERVHGGLPPGAQWLHDWLGQDEVVLSLARHDGHLWLDFPDLAAFELQFPAGRIGVHCSPSADENTLEHLLVDQVLPRYVAHLDTLVAHASAIAIHGRHALFLGQSGWGKSTLAALLLRSGHGVLSDDCVQLFEEGNQLLALSTYPSLRLLPDSLDELFPGMENASPMADYSDKLRVPVTPPQGDCVATAIDALYVLADPELAQGAIHITPLPPGEACRALIEHSFRLDLNDRLGNASHFARCSAVARAVPAFEIQFPRDYAQGPELARKIAHHLSSLSLDR